MLLEQRSTFQDYARITHMNPEICLKFEKLSKKDQAKVKSLHDAEAEPGHAKSLLGIFNTNAQTKVLNQFLDTKCNAKK